MKKQSSFPDFENTRLDEKIEKVMQRDFPLPEKAEQAQAEAFAKIKEIQTQRGAEESRKIVGLRAAKKDKAGRKSFRRGGFFKTCMGMVAAAAAFSGLCIVNPAFAAQVPLVGHVFEEIGESLGFSGDYSKYAKPLDETAENTDMEVLEESGKAVAAEDKKEENSGAAEGENPLFSQTKNGMTITLSEVYCNDVSLYLSMIIKSEEKLPETLKNQENKPVIQLLRSKLKFSYNNQEQQLDGSADSLDGKLIDDYTYAGVLRCELDGSVKEADEEGLSVTLTIPQVVGYKPESEAPEMPEELRAEYEQAMKDNGLGLTDEDYGGFTEEQRELEHELFTKMMNTYSERYPDTNKVPNKYEHWWVDGPWEFTFDVTRDGSQNIVKEINDVNEAGLGLVSVTKTPFEITIEDGRSVDYFTVALDANGDILPYGNGSNANVYAIQDRDVSRIDIYICDYTEYMDELKGYYWSADYEEKKKEKTFKQLLDERALYHKEVVFEE